MCGISGIFHCSQNPIPAERYRSANIKMTEAQMERGPDAQATWDDGIAFLGHTRLAIMDPESTESNQPVHGNRYTLVYNGEIYNFRRIREELEAAGIDFRTECDTEVLLQAIEHWGVDASLEKLNGIFAFAAYDRQAKALHLVRDRLGIKPLYYHVSDDGAVWFASAPASIAKTARNTWTLDYEGLYTHFRLGAPCGEATLFSDIARVLPAEHIRINRDGALHKSIYWTPSMRDGDIVEGVYEAALRQKEAHVRSALFLSGGVDSSVLSNVLRDIDFFHLDSPEREFAEYVASFVNRNLIVKSFESNVAFDEFNRHYVISSGEPSASAPIPYLIAKAMQEEKFKVAFSANGADELFFGYPRTPSPELHKRNFPAIAYEQLSTEKDQEQLEHIFRNRSSFSIPRAKDETRRMRKDTWIRKSVSRLSRDFPPSAQSRWFELMTYVAFDLNQTLDFASMACSLEVRVPFLDHELVELALSKNANEMVTADFGRKTPLKKALKQQGLHPALWARPKLGFSIPPEVLAKRQHSLAEAVRELEREGYLSLNSTCASGSRDDQYLHSAAHAFLTWKQEWIDSGKVAA